MRQWISTVNMQSNYHFQQYSHTFLALGLDPVCGPDLAHGADPPGAQCSCAEMAKPGWGLDAASREWPGQGLASCMGLGAGLHHMAKSDTSQAIPGSSTGALALCGCTGHWPGFFCTATSGPSSTKPLKDRTQSSVQDYPGLIQLYGAWKIAPIPSPPNFWTCRKTHRLDYKAP